MRILPALAIAVIVSCSPTTPSPGGGGPPGNNGLPPVACAPACVLPKVCNQAGTCVTPGTGCTSDGQCVQGQICSTSGRCEPGGGCGLRHLNAQAVPPNLLVVLDRSCSMRRTVGTRSKWEIAVGALSTLTDLYRGRIRFGLTLFPDTQGLECSQEEAYIVPGENREDQIQSRLTASLSTSDQYYPQGPCVTNIDTAMAQAAAEPALSDSARRSYVLLLTDGKQAGCGDSAAQDLDTTRTIRRLNNDSVPTFVVGFGDDTEIDPNQMKIFAEAGGVPSSNPRTPYYRAEDEASLRTALEAIGRRAAGCSVRLNEAAPDWNKIYVFFDKTVVVPRDRNHQNGWDYTPANQEVEFYGSYCTQLQSGSVQAVDIVSGCGTGGSCAEDSASCGAGLPECPANYVCATGCCVELG